MLYHELEDGMYSVTPYFFAKVQYICTGGLEAKDSILSLPRSIPGWEPQPLGVALSAGSKPG